MLIAFIVIFIIAWIVGALITLKADAVTSNNPTDWRDLWLSLIFWIPVAILICCSKHTVCRHYDWSKTDFYF